MIERRGRRFTTLGSIIIIIIFSIIVSISTRITITQSTPCLSESVRYIFTSPLSLRLFRHWQVRSVSSWSICALLLRDTIRDSPPLNPLSPPVISGVTQDPSG